MRWTSREKHLAVCEVVGVSGFNEGQWTSIAGRIEAILIMCGAKQATCDVSRPQVTGCELVTRWRP